MDNPNIDFPIGIAFGDRDFMGSEGADSIIKSSKYFENGQSQLFVIPNAGHNTHEHNPKALLEVLIGFFNGTKRHVY